MRIKLVKRFAYLTRGGGAHILLEKVESLLRVKQASNYGAARMLTMGEIRF